MRILLNELPGEKSLFLERGEINPLFVKKAIKEHKISSVLLNDFCSESGKLGELKNMGIKIGILADSLEFEKIGSLVEKNFFDFVALRLRGTAGLKESVGMLRASGTRYEVRADASLLGKELINEAYEFCQPCDLFAVYNVPSTEFFTSFAKDKPNVLMRNNR